MLCRASKPHVRLHTCCNTSDRLACTVPWLLSVAQAAINVGQVLALYYAVLRHVVQHVCVSCVSIEETQRAQTCCATPTAMYMQLCKHTTSHDRQRTPQIQTGITPPWALASVLLLVTPFSLHHAAIPPRPPPHTHKFFLTGHYKNKPNVSLPWALACRPWW
jgi:hypothetical protein